MSAPLTGLEIQNSYRQVLIVNSGLSSTGGVVADGLGNDSCLTLSDAECYVVGTVTAAMPQGNVTALRVLADPSPTVNVLEVLDSSGTAVIYVDHTLQLAFDTTNGPAYFGDFSSTTLGQVGFSFPGAKVFEVDSGINCGLLGQAFPTNYQGAKRVTFVGNRTTLPTGNPIAGGFFYSDAGALYWHGSSGTVTLLAPA